MHKFITSEGLSENLVARELYEILLVDNVLLFLIYLK